MESTFTHFILTRNNYPPDHPNLDERLWLLRNFTANSVQVQSNTNFRWVLSGAPVRGINAEFTKSFPSVIASAQTDWVITTRLDNDDLIAPDFVEVIQREASQRTEVIDMPGWRLNTRTSEVVEFNMYHEHRASPFASLVQPSIKAGPGIFVRQHGQLHEDFLVRVLERRGWAQVISPFNKLMRWQEGNTRVSENWLTPYLALANSTDWLHDSAT